MAGRTDKMPSMGRRPKGEEPGVMRSIRVERKLWDEFGALAEAEGAERSEVLRDYIRQYVAEHRPEDDASE